MIINQTIHIELAPEGPKIIDGYWHEWVNGEWVNTGRKAEGEDGTDGYSVSLSKSEHTFNYDKNGNLKGILSDGTISVEVFNGATPLICDSLGVLAPTTDGTYRVTDITISPSTTLSYNVDRLNNVFRLIPTMIDAEEVRVTFTIVARTKGVNTTFTRHLKYQKRHDGADGFTVSMSKSSHTYVTDSAGNIKGAISSGAVAVLVRNGNTIFTCPSTSWHSIPANGQYVVTSVDAPGTLPMSFSLSNNQYVLTPMALAVTEARVVVTITAKMNNILYYFSAEITYNKVSDGGQGSTGDGVVHIYRQFPTKPSVPGAGIANPAGWSRNPDFLLSITNPTNWISDGKWYQSEELTAIGNSTVSKIVFTTSKDNQTITIELWGDGHATYDYVYAGKLNTPVTTSNYFDRVRAGKKVITYEVPSAGSHYIEIIWRKGISTIAGSNRGYFSIVNDVKVWRSTTNVIADVYQVWSDPSPFMVDTSTEERIYCLSKTTASPLISDSDAYIDDYIPLPCALSSYRGDFTTYRAYSVGQVVVYLLDFYKVVKAVNSLYTGDPTNTEFFEKIKSWTDNPTGANKEYPYEIVGIRKKVDGLWGPYVTSVWSNYGIGTNYVPMGWWNSTVTYSKTDLGVPLIKKEDGTALGYSVYTLKVAASTPGSFILSEWDLVESAEFIYMQQAYIERLQAQLISAVTVELREDPSSDVTAGFSGIQGPYKDKPAFWSGGTYQDATNGTSKSLDRHDGSGHRAGGNVKWDKNGSTEFRAGLRHPFVGVYDEPITDFWDGDITSWANNFYHYSPFASLTTRYVPCNNKLNGQLFRIHCIRGSFILASEVANGFQEDGGTISQIQMNAGQAIEMICICINGSFYSWDIIKRYTCRSILINDI